jgi:ATP-dependent Clp protease protease subunit
MASQEAQFISRAERLAGPRGITGLQAQDRYILPQFSEKTPYGMKTQDPYTKLFEDRIIFMGVQVDDTSCDDIMAQLLVLESQDPNRDVMMYINSPGGSMTAMTAIYDTMQYIQPDVQTVCLGQAASAGRHPARGRHQGQAAHSAQRPRADPPAGHRSGLRQGHRDRDPG